MNKFWRRYFSLLFIICGLSATASCSTLIEPQQTEAQALESLRGLTRDGQLPSEAAAASLEARFPNTKTAGLARLLRAFILLQRNQSGDALNASGLLDTDLIAKKTNVGDYALFLRGQALFKAGKSPEAAAVFEKLLTQFPDSLRTRDAKLGLAQIRANASEIERVSSVLSDLIQRNDAAALLILAQVSERAGRLPEAIAAYRRIYFYAPASNEAADAETSLKRLAIDVNSPTLDENLARANGFYQAKKFAEAANIYQTIYNASPTALTPQLNLQRGAALANQKKFADAAIAFNSIPATAGELRAQALSKAAEANANANLWTNARQGVEQLRREFPTNQLVPQTFVSVGTIARDRKNRIEESYYLQTALAAFPNAAEVGKAQFDLAWMQHDAKNFPASSQALIEHLARYAAKDTTYRGRAGYWAARDSERAGKLPQACVLYQAMQARYDANWYGYLAKQRLEAIKNNCSTNFTPDAVLNQAAANLQTITVAPETSGQREAASIQKADELGSVALYDFALEELNTAAKTASNSPKVNLGLARLYRYKNDFVAAFLALGKSYPDFSQMKPEELSPEEWDIFYPLKYWDAIKTFAKQRSLDPHQVAGLIRQESVFYTRAKSGANAFGLMQLILPTAKTMARKYSANTVNSAEDLYNPSLNIELGTAYMREQLDNYGRIEYLAAAYNAGPGRVVTWRQTLPFEMDEWVEAIPFRETKAYVQGVVRNTAQYRRLYDDNGKFRPNVGSKPLRAEIDQKPREQFARENPQIKIDDRDGAE